MVTASPTRGSLAEKLWHLSLPLTGEGVTVKAVTDEVKEYKIGEKSS